MRPLWIVALALGLAAPGCGYTFGYRMAPGVYRVAVPQFRNETFPLRREIEYQLTRAVKQELELRTDTAIVDRDQADGILEGTVISFTQGILTEGALDTVQESSIRVSARIRLLRASDESVIFDQVITDDATFSTAGGQTIADARAEAVLQIAQRIVASLESWD